MSQAKHPAGPVLLAYHHGEMDASEAAKIAVHCEECAACRTELDELKSVNLFLAKGPTPELPRTVWHRVRPGRNQSARTSRLQAAFVLAACAAGIVFGILIGPIQFSAESQTDKQLAWSETVTIWDSGASATLLSVYQTAED